MKGIFGLLSQTCDNGNGKGKGPVINKGGGGGYKTVRGCEVLPLQKGVCMETVLAMQKRGHTFICFGVVLTRELEVLAIKAQTVSIL